MPRYVPPPLRGMSGNPPSTSKAPAQTYSQMVVEGPPSPRTASAVTEIGGGVSLKGYMGTTATDAAQQNYKTGFGPFRSRDSAFESIQQRRSRQQYKSAMPAEQLRNSVSDQQELHGVSEASKKPRYAGGIGYLPGLGAMPYSNSTLVSTNFDSVGAGVSTGKFATSTPNSQKNHDPTRASPLADSAKPAGSTDTVVHPIASSQLDPNPVSGSLIADQIMKGEMSPKGNYRFLVHPTGRPQHYRGSHAMSPEGVTRQTHNVPRSRHPSNKDKSTVTHEEEKVRTPNVKGNVAAYLNVKVVPYPEWFARIQTGFRPTIEAMCDVLPCMEACRYAVPSTASVIRINNIPFDASRSDILALFGNSARICRMPVGTGWFAAHIIAERHSGKTMDAFVEMESEVDAVLIINQLAKRYYPNRPKVGTREVYVLLSSQEEMMAELFPHSKNVKWHGGTPHIVEEREMYYDGVLSADFNGFLQVEEVLMVTKHAEVPHRSPFAARAVVRIYEYWITTLYKYPWYAHELVFMSERIMIFNGTLALLRALCTTLVKNAKKPHQTGRPSIVTLHEFCVAIFTCPGFSESQKAKFRNTLTTAGLAVYAFSQLHHLGHGGVSPFSAAWPFQAIAIDPRMPPEMVTYFAWLCRQATAENISGMSLRDRLARRAVGAAPVPNGPFGNVEIDYTMADGSRAMTLAQTGEIELEYVEKILAKVLPRQ